MKPKYNFKFGDIIENHYASEDNPRRKGIFVQKNSRGHYEMTDGKGSFWLSAADNDKLVKTGSALGGSDPIPLPTIKPGDIIADLLFAFINQDADCPHDFEIQAVEAAVNYLKNHYQSDKYNPLLFESHLKQMLEVSHD